jgi:hypothetical protein
MWQALSSTGNCGRSLTQKNVWVALSIHTACDVTRNRASITKLVSGQAPRSPPIVRSLQSRCAPSEVVSNRTNLRMSSPHTCYRRGGGASAFGVLSGFATFYLHGSLTIAIIVAASIFGAIILFTGLTICMVQRQTEARLEVARRQAVRRRAAQAQHTNAQQRQQQPQIDAPPPWSPPGAADAPPPYMPPEAHASDAAGAPSHVPPPAYPGSAVVHIHAQPETNYSLNAGMSGSPGESETTPLLRR